MKKKLPLIMAMVFMLGACTASGGNDSKSDGNKTVPDELLRETPELKEDYNNPVALPVAHGSNEAADPFVYRFNGKYYLYMTTGGSFVRCYVSSDLLNWEPATNGPGVGICYESSPGNAIGNVPYAPEVIYYNGYFYMVTSPSGNGHFILVGESPEGPFHDITGNFQKSIDGSFFIDHDEQAYMFTAGGNAIMGYKVALEPDGVEFEKNDDSDWAMAYSETHLGAWNEGPYMLKRFGAYYMTHTGTHYLSPAYRVNYIYAPKGSDVSKSSSFTHIDNLNTLVATEDDFHALGHSSTVLGPDMDSYYIAYHSMKGNSSFRYYNINRLSFNGGNMTINEYGMHYNQSPSLPEYAVESSDDMQESGNIYFSNKEHNSDAFTAEFNTVGEGKMYFAYQSDKEYSYLEFRDNCLTLVQHSGGKDRIIEDIPLNNQYDTDVLHTFRINYGYGKAAIYFDTMEKAYDIPCTFKKGKIGVDASFSDIQYCAFSNVGGGKSDKVEYNSQKILANAYSDELSILNGADSGMSYSEKKGNSKIIDNGLLTLAKQGDRATYLMRQNEDNKYNIALRIPYSMLGKKLGLRLNDGEIKEITIPNNTPKVKNGDIYLNITTLDLDYDEYWLSIVNVGDEVSFYEIDIEPVYENPEYDFDLTSTFNKDGDFIIRNTHNYSSKGLVTAYDADAFGFISKERFINPYVSTTFTLTGSSEAIGFLGLLANVNNYNNSTSLEANPGYMEQGYMLKVEADCVKLCYVDFNYITDVATYRESLKNNIEYELSMEIENNHIVAYLNGEVIIDIYANIGRLSGQVGVLAYRVDSVNSHFVAF